MPSSPFLLGFLLVFAAAVLSTEAETNPFGGKETDRVFYVGAEGEQTFHCVHRLHNGTWLLGGSTDQPRFLPGDTPASLIPLAPFEGKGPSGRHGFLLHLSAKLDRVLQLYIFPKDVTTGVDTIRYSKRSSELGGGLFISGGLASDPETKNGKAGYFIAKLNGNLVESIFTGFAWTHAVRATGALLKTPAWDVGSDGRVVYAEGEPYSYNWFAIKALTGDGTPAVVPNWRRHWVKVPGETKEDGSPKTREFAGLAKDAPGPVVESGIVLKVWDRGDFRSWDKTGFEEKSDDGNGGIKQGRWPFDAMFDGYFDPETKKTVPVTDTKKGYYGYRWGGTPCAHVGAICIDRRDNAVYIGGNNKSKLPDGKPDFEPWVVALTAEGHLRWWQRLYAESKGVSTPDQYVDGLTIHYPKNALIVAARAHGNNVNNFWTGDEIEHRENPGRGFQNGFTGTHGNMHFSWLGRMTLAKGAMLNATYFAEFGEGNKFQDKRFQDEQLDHWPHFHAGWPNLNTTKIKGGPAVDDAGNIYLAAQGRRVITTKNAFQAMPSPLDDPKAKGAWSHFVRVYEPDLTRPLYSSLVNGAWDWSTGGGHNQITLTGVQPAATTSVLVVGHANAEGTPVQTRNVPAWGAAAPKGQGSGVIAILGR